MTNEREKPITEGVTRCSDDEARVAWENTLTGRLHRVLVSTPLVGKPVMRLHALLFRQDTNDYWEERYRRGGDSGSGSYGRLAHFKAEVLNRLIRERAIESIVEFGCGDGHQLELADYPSYIGVDVSETAIHRCRDRFKSDPSKQFLLAGATHVPQADCTLSLDVILHLVEDAAFERYMHTLFTKANRYVIIYSSDFEERFAAPHVRHRKFSTWVSRNHAEFTLESKIPNKHGAAISGPDTSNADFYIYRRLDPQRASAGAPLASPPETSS